MGYKRNMNLICIMVLLWTNGFQLPRLCGHMPSENDCLVFIGQRGNGVKKFFTPIGLFILHIHSYYDMSSPCYKKVEVKNINKNFQNKNINKEHEEMPFTNLCIYN